MECLLAAFDQILCILKPTSPYPGLPNSSNNENIILEPNAKDGALTKLIEEKESLKRALAEAEVLLLS
jgi:hypothetical protein